MEEVTPRNYYEPPAENELAERRVMTCKELNEKIELMEDEQEEMKLFLKGVHFLNFNLKDQILDQYEEKIRNRKEELEGIEEVLREDGINWRW